MVRADWDVYLNGRKLIYRKQPCAPADVLAKLVLRVFPADPGVFSIILKWPSYDNFSFYFDQRGFWLDDQCIASVQLPDYDINRIRVGQWLSAENRTLWDAEFSPGRGG